MLVRVFHILPQGVGWLSEPKTAMASVIAVNIWRGFPFFGISFLAGMKAIPAELYEAAAVDGANAVQRFRHVTLASLRNIVVIVMLLSTIWTFNDFQIVYILTKGGPGGATQVLPVLTYEIAFGAQRLGEAIAVALYMSGRRDKTKPTTISTSPTTTPSVFFQPKPGFGAIPSVLASRERRKSSTPTPIRTHAVCMVASRVPT